MKGNQREHWGSSLGFLAACAGSAIGLGSLWRFPYICSKHGGGFFIAFFVLFTAILALPIFIAELIIGRRTRCAPLKALQQLQLASGSVVVPIGLLSVASNFVILSFYCVIAGWGLYYLHLSINHFTLNQSPDQIAAHFDRLYQSVELNFLSTYSFLLLTALVVLGGVKKGIEICSQLLTPALLILIVGAFYYAMQLSGFAEASYYLFHLDLQQLHWQGVLEVLGMSFFTMSVGLGILITYGSYLPPHHAIASSAAVVALTNIVISILISWILFTMSFTCHLPLDQGPGLVFKIVPILCSQLPHSYFACILFFVVFLLTALTSSVSILEVLVRSTIEGLCWSRRRSVAVWLLATGVAAAPSAMAGTQSIFNSWIAWSGKDFLSMLNSLSDWSLSLCALFFAWIAIYKISLPVARAEFSACNKPLTSHMFGLWHKCLQIVVPISMMAILTQKLGFF